MTGRKDEAEDILQNFKNVDREAVRLYGELFINAALGTLTGRSMR